MTVPMNWPTLLSKERFVPAGITADIHSAPSNRVTPFQEDANRILYSSAFRRLQGKTQVHPFPRFDYLRTRLTHTIEVASVGRTIAAAVATEIKDNDATPQTLGDIVYAACLAHDLGNPPFGHSGEYAIQIWFEQNGEQEIQTMLESNAQHKNDFVCFDGNAQGFRTITKVMPFRGEGGLRLTYATLGAFSKYPYSSKFANDSKKKFGFFQEDEASARKVYSGLGLLEDPKAAAGNTKYCQHPLALVVEAADDICYLTTDIEDAFRSKVIDFATAELLLKGIGEGGGHIPQYHQIPVKDFQDRVAYLRAGAINSLIDDAILQFCSHLDEIMNGSFGQPLLAKSKYADGIADIRNNAAKFLYLDRRKLEVEQTGFSAISGLMNVFGEMILTLKKRGSVDLLDPANRRLFQLLPDEYARRLNASNLYGSLLVLTDYVAGMTDTYALTLFQKLTGTRTDL